MSQATTEDQRRNIIDGAFTKYLDFIGENELHDIARSVLLHLKNPSDRDVASGLNIPFAGASTVAGNHELTAQEFAKSYQVAIKKIGDALGYPGYSEEQLVRNAMRDRALELYKEFIRKNEDVVNKLVRASEISFEEKRSWLGGASYIIRGKQDNLLTLIEGLLIPDVNKDKIKCTRNRESGLWTINVKSPVDDLGMFSGCASLYNTQQTNARSAA